MHDVSGDAWLEGILRAFTHHLAAYLEAMDTQPYTLQYVDAFTSTARRSAPNDDCAKFAEGMTVAAFELEPAFTKYVFLEKHPPYAADLEALKIDYAELSIRIERGEVNQFIFHWAPRMGSKDRAFMLIDPLATGLSWAAVEALAATKKVDVWFFIPASTLAQEGGSPEFQKAISNFLGSDAWKIEKSSVAESDEGSQASSRLAGAILDRLASVFSAVLDKPVPLQGSRGEPSYVGCFASSNPNGARVAVPVAKKWAAAMRADC